MDIESPSGLPDHPLNFANSVVRLLRSSELRFKLSENARSLVESNYEWNEILKRFAKKIMGCVTQHNESQSNASK